MCYNITQNYDIVTVLIADDLVCTYLTHRSDPVQSDSSLKFNLFFLVSSLDASKLSVIFTRVSSLVPHDQCVM
jgi:hypothetical protein